MMRKNRHLKNFVRIVPMLLFMGVVTAGCEADTVNAKLKNNQDETERLEVVKGDNPIIGYRFDDNRNPNVIYFMTDGYDELTEEDVSGIEFGEGIPSDSSYIGLNERYESCKTTRDEAVITHIMYDLDKIYVEPIEEADRDYDSVLELVVHPDGYYGPYKIRIRRNTQENKYIIQAEYSDAGWGKVVSGEEYCEDLFEFCEAQGVEITSYPINCSPIRYVGQESGDNLRIFLWKDLKAEDIVRVEFLFGEVIEDRETIERIANDLKQIICRKIDYDKERTDVSCSVDTSIEMTIVGGSPESTYRVRIPRNTPYNNYWIDKQKYNPNFEESYNLRLVDGYGGVQDLWNLYDECQKAYLGLN